MLNPKIVREFWVFMAVFFIVGAHYYVTGIIFALIVCVAVLVVETANAAYHRKEAELAKAKTNNKKRK